MDTDEHGFPESCDPLNFPDGSGIRVYPCSSVVKNPPPYLGRLAPSPTGHLHLGHARTFWLAAERARAAGGALLLRNDDLDALRFRLDFVAAMLADLRWLGFTWREPVVTQSARMPRYRAALAALLGRAGALQASMPPARAGFFATAFFEAAAFLPAAVFVFFAAVLAIMSLPVSPLLTVMSPAGAPC